MHKNQGNSDKSINKLEFSYSKVLYWYNLLIG